MKQQAGSPWCHVPSYRLWGCVLSLVIAVIGVAQDRATIQGTGTIRIDSDVLQEEMVRVPGMGHYALGIDLLEQSATRIILADDTAIATRDLRRHDWPMLRGDSVPMIAAGATYWVRFPIDPSPQLKGVPLSLSVTARVPFELYLNGVVVLRAAQRPLGRTGPLAAQIEDFQPMVVQIMFACDGKPEVLAARVQSLPGASPVYPPLRLSLQSARTSHTVPRLTMHYGICVGVNLIIAVLALIIWWWDRRERSWLMLAFQAVVTAGMALCDVGGELAFLGFSSDLPGYLRAALVPLLGWNLLLIILILRGMRGDPIGRFRKVFIGLAVALSLSVLVVILMARSGMDMSIVRLPMGILILIIVVGFAVEVVRSSLLVLRSTGFERWFGVGTFSFILLSVLTGAIGHLTDASHFSWLGVAALYGFYLSVPVSVAIYLAVRSGKNNRLVARQRDELDMEVQERTADLSREKQRSDDLLLNILPEEVAEELKNTGAAQAKLFDVVTILFTDFKGFTQLSELVTPSELVAELNICFKAFDHIITARGIEKIKTIGDAYMAAGGLPDPASSRPADVVFAALEMQDFMKKHKAARQAAGKPFFEMRLGIHSGPVVAGIVGVKKFQYDIWGDTVNTASRMESSGEVGQVNISAATYALVKDKPGLSFAPRGKVLTKGKGEMEMYFVKAS